MNSAGAVLTLGAMSALLTGMVHVPAGDYRPIRGMGGMRMPVTAFEIDAHAVSRADYLRFVKTHAEWRRGSVDSKRVDASYLAEWRGALEPGDSADLRRPVTSVSWYAATAYCEAQSKRLPTTDEWEYIAAASDVSRDGSRDQLFQSRLLKMYASRSSGAIPAVGSGSRNVYGIEGLHGSTWEWTRDFKPEEMANCGGAALGASDATNYPALLREAFRSALNERSTTRMLGFRCAANAR